MSVGSFEYRQRRQEQVRPVQSSEDHAHDTAEKTNVIPFIHHRCAGPAKLTGSRGNLSNRSLTAIVDPSLLVQDSEYLETHLIAVPNQVVKEFLKSYETIAPMVVPRSAQQIRSDDEFTLYAVTTFKRHSLEFLHKCRESKWTPRDYKYREGGREAEQQEVERVGKEERKLWGEALRLGRTAWGEAVMAWLHVMVLRVFVETVLRYGLPLSFVCGLVQVCAGPGNVISRFHFGCCSMRLTPVSMGRRRPN